MTPQEKVQQIADVLGIEVWMATGGLLQPRTPTTPPGKTLWFTPNPPANRRQAMSERVIVGFYVIRSVRRLRNLFARRYCVWATVKGVPPVKSYLWESFKSPEEAMEALRNECLPSRCECDGPAPHRMGLIMYTRKDQPHEPR